MCRGFQFLVFIFVSVAENIKTHQAYYFRTSINVFCITEGVIFGLVEVKFHALEKCFNQGQVNIITVDGQLKALEDGVEAYAFFNGFVGIFFKVGKQSFLIKFMKGVDNFICEAYKAVNIIDRTLNVAVQQFDGTAE